jgi:hypothetical protein
MHKLLPAADYGVLEHPSNVRHTPLQSRPLRALSIMTEHLEADSFLAVCRDEGFHSTRDYRAELIHRHGVREQGRREGSEVMGLRNLMFHHGDDPIPSSKKSNDYLINASPYI